MSAAIPNAIGTEAGRAAVPARMRMSRISSVAYATEESASDAKTARPVTRVSRSCLASVVGMGVPTSRRFSPRSGMGSPVRPAEEGHGGTGGALG